MADFGDSEFPYPRCLKVPFVFVPEGAPLPLEWMAEHPGFVTFAAKFIPHTQQIPPPEPERDAAMPEAPAPGIAPSLDADGNTRRIVPKPPVEGDGSRQAAPFPDRLLKVVPPPGPSAAHQATPDGHQPSAASLNRGVRNTLSI